jgi:hypothetical protein
VSDERDVIVVAVEDRPGTVAQVAGKLADAGANIELAYTTFGAGLGSRLGSTTSRRRARRSDPAPRVPDDCLLASWRCKMKPRIDATDFGSITVEGTVFDHDVVISPDGEVSKRKKKLSKAVYGTSHTISLEEAKYICRRAAGADRLIVGAGQYGRVRLSPEAADFFAQKACEIVLLPTPQVIGLWNETEGRAVGLFHVTC